MDAARFCTECGKEVKTTAKFCSKCGTELAVESFVAQNAPVTSDEILIHVEGVIHQVINNIRSVKSALLDCSSVYLDAGCIDSISVICTSNEIKHSNKTIQYTEELLTKSHERESQLLKIISDSLSLISDILEQLEQLEREIVDK